MVDDAFQSLLRQQQQSAGETPNKGGAAGPLGLAASGFLANLQDTPGWVPDAKGPLENKVGGGGLAALSSQKSPTMVEKLFNSIHSGFQKSNQESGGSGGGSGGGGGSSAPVSSSGGGGGSLVGGGNAGLTAAIAQASGISAAMGENFVSTPIAQMQVDQTPSVPSATPAPPVADAPSLA